MKLLLNDFLPGNEQAATVEVTRFVRIKRQDAAKKQVFGEVYVPDTLDTWGEYMSPEDVKVLAYRFMQLRTQQVAIDTMHDERSNGSFPIESFIARDNDPDYTPGSWVMGVQITDDEIWARVQRGELNGFSFQAMVRKVPSLVEIDIPVETIGQTEINQGHDHYFFVALDADGRVIGGRTSTDAGHSHEIKQATATEITNNHAHRYFF